MSDQDQRVPILIASIDGSSASDDGKSIKVGFTVSDGGERADAIMSADRGVDLMVAVGAALGAARGKRTGEPNARMVYPAAKWEIAPQQNDQLLTFAFQLKGGAEICFQFDRTNAYRFLEGLSAALGLVETPSIPQSQKH